MSTTINETTDAAAELSALRDRLNQAATRAAHAGGSHPQMAAKMLRDLVGEVDAVHDALRRFAFPDDDAYVGLLAVSLAIGHAADGDAEKAGRVLVEAFEEVAATPCFACDDTGTYRVVGGIGMLPYSKTCSCSAGDAGGAA